MKELTESKNERLAEISQECENRCIFVMMVAMCFTNELSGFLKKMNSEELQFLARIWDSHCMTPIGAMLNRPNFDGHEERNQDFQQ